jgi:hypothetical protein
MKKAPGLLPSPGWLQRNGWRGLDLMMRKHPKAFAHIKQNSNKGNSPKEWRAIALSMAKERGSLPTKAWLYSHGCSGMTRAMREYPELFTDIQTDFDGGRSAEEWVQTAEILEAERGSLPCRRWLTKNGYSGLTRAINEHPAVFAHIKQDRPFRSRTAWKKIAENLAREHGSLPDGAWLRQHGYEALIQSMTAHPELYVHIPKAERRWKTAEEWIPVAEHLAEQHGGCLPSKRWLNAHGYEGLRGAKERRPDLFAHVKQPRAHRRTPEEWVIVAENLAKKHRKLPNPKWLETHGFQQLNNVRLRNPSLFAHIQQERKSGRTREEWVLIAEELAAKYKGLPRTPWLNENGFNGLVQMRTKYRELFEHIPKRSTAL